MEDKQNLIIIALLVLRDRAMATKETNKKACPRCGHSYPLTDIIDGQERYNFAPESFINPDGKRENICMQCKIQEVKKIWSGK